MDKWTAKTQYLQYYYNGDKRRKMTTPLKKWRFCRF